jgi:hypothetical protein
MISHLATEVKFHPSLLLPDKLRDGAVLTGWMKEYEYT